MRYKVGDKVVVIKCFMGFTHEIFYTINDVEGSSYFMEESWFWYGEDEIAGFAEDFVIKDRFEILDL